MARIIVVDDEVGIRDNIARYLLQLGHEVRVASHGRDALAVLEAGPADLVVADINMPVMDGIEVLTALREAPEPVPVIAMSGGGLLDKEMLLDSAKLLGAVVTLQKPFDLEELRDWVERIIQLDQRTD